MPAYLGELQGQIEESTKVIKMGKKKREGFEWPPELHGMDAEKFIAQDKEPLTEKQKEHLRKCLKIYEDNPIKDKGE